jgi:hypothetical protein
MKESEQLLKKAEEAHHKILIELGKDVKKHILSDFKEFNLDEFIKETKSLYFRQSDE